MRWVQVLTCSAFSIGAWAQVYRPAGAVSTHSVPIHRISRLRTAAGKRSLALARGLGEGRASECGAAQAAEPRQSSDGALRGGFPRLRHGTPALQKGSGICGSRAFFKSYAALKSYAAKLAERELDKPPRPKFAIGNRSHVRGCRRALLDPRG